VSATKGHERGSIAALELRADGLVSRALRAPYNPGCWPVGNPMSHRVRRAGFYRLFINSDGTIECVVADSGNAHRELWDAGSRAWVPFGAITESVIHGQRYWLEFKDSMQLRVFKRVLKGITKHERTQSCFRHNEGTTLTAPCEALRSPGRFVKGGVKPVLPHIW
jgi:hypothetical protein